MNYSNVNKKLTVFFIVLFCLAPMLFISNNLIFNFLGDNFVYNSYYQGASTNILQNQILFSTITGAKDFIYPLIVWGTSFIFRNYLCFTLFLNFLFILSLTLFIHKYFNYSKGLWILLLYYISTDYYIFVLLGEIHRLKLATTFFLLYLTFYGQFKGSVYFFLSIISHYQIVILFVTKRIKIPAKKIVFYFPLLFLVLCLVFFKAFDKILYYTKDGDINSLIKTSFIVLLFLFIYTVININLKKWHLLLFVTILILSGLIGGDRINIFLIESSVFYLLYKYYELSFKKRAFLGCFIVVISFYNIYKIYGKYTYMMYGG